MNHSLFLTGSGNGNIYLWSIKEDLPIKCDESHNEKINCIKAAKDARYCIVGSNDLRISYLEFEND